MVLTRPMMHRSETVAAVGLGAARTTAGLQRQEAEIEKDGSMNMWLNVKQQLDQVIKAKQEKELDEKRFEAARSAWVNSMLRRRPSERRQDMKDERQRAVLWRRDTRARMGELREMIENLRDERRDKIWQLDRRVERIRKIIDPTRKGHDRELQTDGNISAESNAPYIYLAETIFPDSSVEDEVVYDLSSSEPVEPPATITLRASGSSALPAIVKPSASTDLYDSDEDALEDVYSAHQGIPTAAASAANDLDPYRRDETNSPTKRRLVTSAVRRWKRLGDLQSTEHGKSVTLPSLTQREVAEDISKSKVAVSEHEGSEASSARVTSSSLGRRRKVLELGVIRRPDSRGLQRPKSSASQGSSFTETMSISDEDQEGEDSQVPQALLNMVRRRPRDTQSGSRVRSKLRQIAQAGSIVAAR